MHFVCLYAITCVICSFKGIHDCLVPVTPYLGGIFTHLRTKGKLPPRVRAMDMRHMLIILPFLLEGLLTDEVEEHNAANQFIHRVVDPSSKMVDITIMLLSWYHLYRRKFPAKDEEDIKDLTTLGERYVCAYCAYCVCFCIYFISYLNEIQSCIFTALGSFGDARSCFLTQTNVENVLWRQKRCILSNMHLMTSPDMVTPRT